MLSWGRLGLDWPCVRVVMKYLKQFPATCSKPAVLDHKGGHDIFPLPATMRFAVKCNRRPSNSDGDRKIFLKQKHSCLFVAKTKLKNTVHSVPLCENSRTERTLHLVYTWQAGPTQLYSWSLSCATWIYAIEVPRVQGLGLYAELYIMVSARWRRTMFKMNA